MNECDNNDIGALINALPIRTMIVKTKDVMGGKKPVFRVYSKEESKDSTHYNEYDGFYVEHQDLKTALCSFISELLTRENGKNQE